MTTILDILQVFLSVMLIFLVLMHSGKDAGLSGAFGVGSGAGPLGGGSLVERNLNRLTVLFAISFVINTILLIVSPLVTWIWIGTLNIAGGGLIALWPFPALAWRRVRRVREPVVRRNTPPPVPAGERA